MIERVEADIFLTCARHTIVIDVRSPKEFIQGHIPGSINIPLFNDEERAIVGTLYKKSGRETAVLKGLELAGPKMADYVKKLHSSTPGKEVLVYCWRGGMRSENMAWLFSQAGYHVFLLNGGYKAYRRHIRSCFSAPATIFVLGGLTGSGKTDILRAIEAEKEQFLDLEMIACHKGSVFGALGQNRQPTNEQFENNLSSAWQQFDLTRPVWIEDESRAIGSVSIPDPVFQKMSLALMIRIDSPHQSRVTRLVSEYAGFAKDELRSALERIREKLGDRIKAVNDALDRDDFQAVAEIALTYYDKSYEHSIARRLGKEIHTIPVMSDDPSTNASIILGFIDSINTHPNMFQHAPDLS